MITISQLKMFSQYPRLTALSNVAVLFVSRKNILNVIVQDHFNCSPLLIFMPKITDCSRGLDFENLLDLFHQGKLILNTL